MRQVPASPARPVGIIGSGRLARHFTHYLNLLGVPVQTWSRRAAIGDPDAACADCGTVLLLISDAAVEPFAAAWPRLGRARLVHCSGALVTTVAEAAHPLMTFGDELYEPEVYFRIPFVLDRDATPLPDLLPIPNQWFTIPASSRPYYHALCVLAGNMSVLLWRKLFEELEGRFGIAPSAAMPYLQQVTANLLREPQRALTGPLARGDLRTIRANIDALGGDPYQAVYAAFARAYEQRA